MLPPREQAEWQSLLHTCPVNLALHLFHAYTAVCSMGYTHSTLSVCELQALQLVKKQPFTCCVSARCHSLYTAIMMSACVTFGLHC